MLPLLDAAETPQNNLSSAQCLYSQRHPTHLVVTARKYTVWSKVKAKQDSPCFPHHTSYTECYEFMQLVGGIANYIALSLQCHSHQNW